MKRVLLFLCTLALVSFVQGAEPVRTTTDFNDDWTFQSVKADGARKTPVNMKKPGDPLEIEQYEKSISVRLPHDWAISGPFNAKDKNGGTGKLPWRGAGLYTKSFDLDQKDANKAVIFDFGGCMAFPEVYINGKYAGGWDYGYLGFQIDATPYLKFGSKNTIQVRCDTRQHGSRWYPGAGIYRSVQMIKRSKIAWFPEGAVFISTAQIDPDKAKIHVKITPEQKGKSNLSAKIVFVHPKTKKSFSFTRSIDSGSVCFEELIPDPILWSPDSPALYAVQAKLYADQKLCDEIVFPFGIRTVKYTADDGFYLNGKRLQLYGVDLHHDQGILGAASHPAAIERQLLIMKDMGVNAVRTSHNPNSPAFMDACDRLGFIVWNELFDKWNNTADLLDQKNFEPFIDRQVRQFVNRDRNRPSVSMWSIGNEITDIEGNKIGSSNPDNKAADRVKYAADCFRKYDTTRQVGLGCCVSGTCANGVRDSLDITGWNYNAQYQNARKVYPKMALVYSESASAVSTRGYYELPHPKGKAIYNKKTIQVDGYDFSSVPWGDIPDPEFERMANDTYCAGEFVWTGFDYLGEPSPFNEEARSSYFGIVDLCGIPKDRFFIYRSYWNPEKTTVHILPHWNWENSGLKKIPVYVYTNGDCAELFLNGKSLGKKSKLKELPTRRNIAVNPKTKVSASSEERKDPRGIHNKAENVLDPDRSTRWCASSPSPDQWLTVDLGSVKKISCWEVVFENALSKYQFDLMVSSDGLNWKNVCSQKEFTESGSSKILYFEQPIPAQYFKVVFKALKPGIWASVRSMVLDDKPVESNRLPEYYEAIDKYRIRWEDVEYQPGTLEAVAWKNGKEIGREMVKTAQAPVKIRLTPEKTVFRSDDDLIYILAETVDSEGNPCPLDTRTISVQLTGPADLVGIGNGNPIGYDRITDAEHPLFFGKAMIVLRSSKNPGSVQVKVSSKGVASSSVNLSKAFMGR
ncbi:MAG: glycoside hydrolase family 2 TIM barrel-domain containing protein [Planctomycetia bacterium]|nr:glycoside hydrolase family 2 TIM barrel-domain containing protein [Planctomycetia bacterium]